MEAKRFSCSASTEHPNIGSSSWTCQNAIDGDENTDWATQNQGVGAWIKINLKRPYWIEKIELKHRSTSSERFQTITLTFSGGTSVGHTLNNDASAWNIVTLTSIVSTNFVKITTNSLWGGVNPGFSEVRLTGCPKSKCV